jgi:hypothetical protein
VFNASCALQLLKNINVERDMNRKREVIKKVIACMTLGIDVSRLFSDMIMVILICGMLLDNIVFISNCSSATGYRD